MTKNQHTVIFYLLLANGITGLMNFTLADQAGARRTCKETAFTCGNGICIPLTWKCDAEDDCGDQSDEFGCHKTECNPDTEFACSNNGCISAILKCDGHKDCPGGEDEELSTCLSASEPETEAHDYLLVARKYDIRKISLDRQETITIINNTKSTVAFDFDFQTGSIFWSESLSHKIYKSSIQNGSEKTIIVSNEQTLTEGLAVDWIYKHLFWSEIRYKTINVAKLDGSFQKVLIKDDIERPRAIAVNPIQGWMFWADWGLNPKIERTGMDGTHRQTIVSSNLGWPNSLTIDFIKGRLYWVDAKLHTISTCDYDGARREVVLFSDQHLQLPYSITTLNDSIYWINLGDQSVYKADKFTGNDVKIVSSQSSSDGVFPIGIHIYDSQRQPDGVNHCTANNGNCSQLCLPAPYLDSKSSKISCACSDGFRLSLDGFSCIEDDSTFYPCNKKTHFGCGNGVCIPNSKLCDKIPDCTDYLDELVENCINECEVNNGGCPHLCVDTPKSFYCDCEPGYKLIGNKTCEIIQ